MTMPAAYFLTAPVLPVENRTSDVDEPWVETRVVGQALPRIDGHERVRGSAVFSIDQSLPGLLHAVILRCPHPHAVVHKVDTSAAEGMRGVRAVLTGSDTEANIPWHLNGSSAFSRLFDPHCRYAGEEVAAVAAETPHQAWDAVRAIRVDYETLPFVLDIDEALKPGAPQLHEGRPVPDSYWKYDRGDVGRGFAEADHVLEQTLPR